MKSIAQASRSASLRIDAKGKIFAERLAQVSLDALLRADEHNLGCGAGCGGGNTGCI
jgi:hypothetical protein